MIEALVSILLIEHISQYFCIWHNQLHILKQCELLPPYHNHCQNPYEGFDTFKPMQIERLTYLFFFIVMASDRDSEKYSIFDLNVCNSY